MLKIWIKHIELYTLKDEGEKIASLNFIATSETIQVAWKRRFERDVIIIDI